MNFCRFYFYMYIIVKANTTHLLIFTIVFTTIIWTKVYSGAARRKLGEVVKSEDLRMG